MPRLLTVAVMLLLTMGCSSPLVLSVPRVAKEVAPGLPRVRIAEITGAPCFGQAVSDYLAAPGGLQLAPFDDPWEITLTGRATRIDVHSNLGDKEAAMLYFTAFVVTAPIAAAMYGSKDWRADGVAEGELTASDPAGAVVWTKSLTVAVAESQRTMPSQEALKAAMTEAVCQKLAATLLNSLTEHLVKRR